jgi:hypothetical protein
MNYNNTIIYKIICNDEAIKDVYIGSTTNLEKRAIVHKSRCMGNNNSPYFKLYDIINQNGGWSNWSIIEIEKYTCSNNKEARTREQYWYNILCPSLNSIMPFNGLNRNEKAKAYYEKNKEKRLLQMAEYAKNHKVDRKEYNKEYMRTYRKKNKNNELSKNWMFNVLTAIN